MMMRSPEFLWLLVVVPALVFVWRWRGGRVPRVALGLRLLVVVLIVVALTDPFLSGQGAGSGMVVVLVDQSDSLGAAGKVALQAQAQAFVARQRGRVVSLVFGETTAVAPWGGPAAQGGAVVRTDGTNIAGALRAARGLIGHDGGRVVLFSDGVQTRGDALHEARQLGVPIDTFGVPPMVQPELWLAALRVPTTLRVGEEYPIEVEIGSSVPGSATLTLSEGQRQLVVEQVTVQAGVTSLRYLSRALGVGVVRLQAVVVGQADGFVRNNRASAVALVAPVPHVLMIEGHAGEAAALRAALLPLGVDAEVVAAVGLPTRLSGLERYAGIMLVDVPASALTLDQMTTLRAFVRSEGRGVIVTGGRSSLTLGGYRDTPLEELLPVSMVLPPRALRPNVTLLLMVDHSASMSASWDVSKLDMAKESAVLTTESLRDEDRIGVLVFDTESQWTVAFQPVSTGVRLAQIQDRIRAIGDGGGTEIARALTIGLEALAQQPGEVRHAVLLTDGRSQGRAEQYQALVERARAQGITLSTIAIGYDADTDLLQDLALWGAGRYHFAAEPRDIPRLTLLESEIARTEPQVEGDFQANLVLPHPMVRAIEVQQLPRLEGYAATTLKPGAELVLESPEQDPVLAVWQYGLGRAVVWTPSVEAPWAMAWSRWSGYGAFWAQIIRYVLPAPDGGPLQVQVTPHVDDDAVTIMADSLAANGEPLDLGDTEAVLTLLDDSVRHIPLRQTAPGRYVEDVRLPSDGAYVIEVRQRKGGLVRSTTIGYVQRSDAEYVPSQGGAALLAQISAVSGGGAHAGEGGAVATRASDAQGQLWSWLLMVAALLWPIEIAVRRRRSR